MATIPKSIIDQLKDRVSLSDMLDRHIGLTKLKSTGSGSGKFTACCPFHNDKSPSLSIDDHKGLFKCFGCGESGDVIDVLTKHRGLTFFNAIKELCNETGVDFDTIQKESQLIANEQPTSSDLIKKSELFINHIFKSHSDYKQHLTPLSQKIEKNPSVKEQIYSLTNIAAMFKTPGINDVFNHIKDQNDLITSAKSANAITGDQFNFHSNKYHIPLYRIGNKIAEDNPLPILSHNGKLSQILCSGFYVMDNNLEVANVYPEIAVHDQSALLMPLFTHSSLQSNLSSVFIVDTPDEYINLIKMGISNIIAPATSTLNASHLRQISSLPVNKITWVTTRRSLSNERIINRMALFAECLLKNQEMKFVFMKSEDGFSKVIQQNGISGIEKINRNSIDYQTVFLQVLNAYEQLPLSSKQSGIYATNIMIKDFCNKNKHQNALTVIDTLAKACGSCPIDVACKALKINLNDLLNSLEKYHLQQTAYIDYSLINQSVTTEEKIALHEHYLNFNFNRVDLEKLIFKGDKYAKVACHIIEHILNRDDVMGSELKQTAHNI